MIDTGRLHLRELRATDASFIVQLLNQPSFLQYIGDRGVRNEDDARRYLADGPQASYARHGFGLWLVADRRDGAPLGICGLLQRDNLEHVDLGFAFLPAYWGQGMAAEASRACLRWASEQRGMTRVLAIVTPGNAASLALLHRLGFAYTGLREIRSGEPPVEVHLRDTAISGPA